MRVDVGSLSSQIAELQGKLEDTNYRLAQVSQQIAATNQDLKAVRSCDRRRAAGAPAALRAAAARRRTPRALYQTSYSDYLRGNYDLAMLGFQQYLETFPETDLADNATYWIGECFYRQQKYAEAIAEYDTRAEAVPAQRQDRERPAEEGLRAARARPAQGRRSPSSRASCGASPSSDEANLARQRLQSLGVDPVSPEGSRISSCAGPGDSVPASRKRKDSPWRTPSRPRSAPRSRRAQRIKNRAARSRMRTAVKKLRAAVATGDATAAEELLPATIKIVDSTAQKGVIHRNTAARTKSRLVARAQGQ